MATVPIRTCIGCRGKFPKKKLLRFVYNLTGGLCTDPKGKLPGRGAYICLSQNCINAAFKSHQRVNSLLRVNLSEQVVTLFKQNLLDTVSQRSGEEGGINEK